MPDRFLVRVFCLVLILLSAAMAEGQRQPGADLGEDDEETLVQPAHPEPPKRTMTVEVTSGLLSVELANVDFGTAIREVAGKAGFKIEGSGEVFSRKLHTKFANIEIERGVTRLLSLVKESNYMLHYTAQGAISKLEIFASSGTAHPGIRQAPGQQVPPRPQPIPQPQIPPRPAAVTPPVIPSRPVPRPAAPPPRAVQPQVLPDDEDDEDDEDIEEIPYIAPQPRKPLFIPKKK